VALQAGELSARVLALAQTRQAEAVCPGMAATRGFKPARGNIRQPLRCASTAAARQRPRRAIHTFGQPWLKICHGHDCPWRKKPPPAGVEITYLVAKACAGTVWRYPLSSRLHGTNVHNLVRYQGRTWRLAGGGRATWFTHEYRNGVKARMRADISVVRVLKQSFDDLCRLPAPDKWSRQQALD